MLCSLRAPVHTFITRRRPPYPAAFRLHPSAVANSTGVVTFTTKSASSNKCVAVPAAGAAGDSRRLDLVLQDCGASAAAGSNGFLLISTGG